MFFVVSLGHYQILSGLCQRISPHPVNVGSMGTYLEHGSPASVFSGGYGVLQIMVSELGMRFATQVNVLLVYQTLMKLMLHCCGTP